MGKQIKFITTQGTRTLKEIDRNEGTHWEICYFDEAILKEYDSDKKYQISDEGYYLNITNLEERWSTGRGLWRVNKGVLSTMIGDLLEGGMPKEHLKLWADKNLKPENVKVLQYYSDFRNSIKRMLHFMKNLNLQVRNLLRGIFEENINEDIFLLEELENELTFVKRFIDSRTPITDFQSRIIFLNTIINEKINIPLLIKILDKFDENLKYSPERRYLRQIVEECPNADKNVIKRCDFLKEPLKGLNLLRRFLLFLRVNYEVINSFKIRSKKELTEQREAIKKKIVDLFEEYYAYQIFNKDFKNKDFFLGVEESINENTQHLKALNKFRSSSSAHGFNQKEYKESLNKFDIPKETIDLSIVFSEIISKVGRDIERVFFELMPAYNPLIENYRDAVRECLQELSKKKDKYEYDFDDLHSYYYEFPELIAESKDELKELFEKSKDNETFLVYLGLFLENLSLISPLDSQDLTYMIIEKMKKVPSDIKYCLAHIAHIIKNSDKLTEEFIKKVKTPIQDNLTKGGDESYMSQCCVYSLYQKFPKVASAMNIKLKKEEVIFDPLKEFLV